MSTKPDKPEIAIEAGSGNAYADIGLPEAGEMRIKAELARRIGQIVKGRHLTQQQAAELLGMTQPKLSQMLRGHFRGISQTRMIDCLNRLGRDVSIVVRKAPRRALGHTQVVVA